jgi:hypothetical protein
MEPGDGEARASFGVRGGTLYVTATHIVLEGRDTLRIPISEVEACRSRRRVLEVVWGGSRRKRLVLRMSSAPAAAAESAVHTSGRAMS